jgi:ABC-type sugar transport system permease subunit
MIFQIRSVPGFKKGNLEPYIYLFPSLAFILLIYLYPFFEVFRESFFNMRKWPGEFVGIRNYVVALSDDNFYLSLWHNIQLLLVIPIILIISLIIAVILHERVFGSKFYRSVLFIPYIVPLVAIGIAFSFFFQYSGAFNQLLIFVRLDFFVNDWLGKPKLALPVVASAIVWRELGFATILFIARLSSVSEDVVDASLIDGAGWWTRLWKIYLPELRNVVEFYIILSIITMISQIFGFVFVITSGGPAKATWVSEFYIYQRSFLYNDRGVGLVMAVVLIFITISLVFLSNRLRRRIGDEASE